MARPSLPDKPLRLTLVTPADEESELILYKVPETVRRTLGEMIIDWGDGTREELRPVITQADLEDMAEDEACWPTAVFRHRYQRPGIYQPRLASDSGMMPLARLPARTTAINSALPTLTLGRSDRRGQILPSAVLPCLVEPLPGQTHSELREVCPQLLRDNPSLRDLDRAFARSQIKAVDPALFAGLTAIDSLREIFADSLLESVPAGLLRAAGPRSRASRAFAGCAQLREVADPFAAGAWPLDHDGMFAGSPLSLLGALPADVRSELGAIRQPAVTTDQPFSFDWLAEPGLEERVILFYPSDLSRDGDFLIAWGDGAEERADFVSRPAISHRWEKAGTYRVTLWSTPGEPVRPFRLGAGVTAIHDPLPAFYPRERRHLGDLTGWAADLRLLTSVPPGLFDRVAEQLTSLDQAFAGCLALREAPDSVFARLPAGATARDAFAFCKSLRRLPASYLARRPADGGDGWVPPEPAEDGS